MLLRVTRLDDVSEFEECETFDVVDEASADALLSESSEWLEATLHEGATTPALRRRLPSSSWCDVRRWPHSPRDLAAFSGDVDAIVAWLRACGVTLEWSQVMRAPWGGRDAGDMCDGPEPDAYLRRDMRRGERDALTSVVALVMREGIERGAIGYRRDYFVDEQRESLDRARETNGWLRRELHATRNEVRRLRGEPEITQEEADAADVRRAVETLIEKRRR